MKIAVSVFSGTLFLVVLLFLLPESWSRRVYNLTVGRFFRHTVESRLAQFGGAARARLSLKTFPGELRILAFKQEKRLELWGRNASDPAWNFLKEFRILTASGTTGPKLKEGDRQVPEGFYEIESLHPNSHFYLALKLAYPSAEDIAMARQDSRDLRRLGSAIMLHGKGGSIGCIAVSNVDMEEIFLLTAKARPENTKILIFPCDFRSRPLPEKTRPGWIGERYRKLCQSLAEFPRG